MARVRHNTKVIATSRVDSVAVKPHEEPTSSTPWPSSTTEQQQQHEYGRNVSAKQRFARHPFDASLIKEVSKYLESNNYDGMLELVEDWSVVAITSLITIYAYHEISGVLGIALYLVAVIVIGGRQRAIADILHQASHGAAAKNAYLNWAIGTIFSGYTVFQSFSIYTASHVKLHHPWLGNPHKDPDYIGLISNKICGINRSKVNTRKYILSLLTPSTSYNYLLYLIRNRIYDRNEDKRETVFRCVYWMAVSFALWYQQCVHYFVLFWFVPLLTSNVWIGSLLELLEHFPMMDDPNIAYVDIFMSKNRIWSHAVNFILGVHHEGYHLVHHLFPKLPSWHYRTVHDILMKDKVYAALDHAEYGVFTMITNVIQTSEPSKQK